MVVTWIALAVVGVAAFWYVWRDYRRTPVDSDDTDAQLW